MSNTAARKNVTKYIWLAVSVVVYLIIIMLPAPSGLSPEGQKALALMISSVILWVSEVLPIGIVSAILPMLTMVLGILPVNVVLKEFMTPTIFFMMAAMVIAIGFTDSGIGERVSLRVSFLFGNSPAKVLLSFMLFTTIVSSFLVDIPTAIIFSGIAYTLLMKNECRPGQSNFGKAMMIGIPISSAIGGFATPVGSGLNILTINTLKQVSGVEINFLQWSCIGIPMALLLVLAAWFIIVRMLPPEISLVKGSEDIKTASQNLGPLKTAEKKFMVIFGLCILAWVTQPFTKIDNTLVAVVCMGIMALPGIDLVTWDKAKARVSWDSLLLVGSATALAMAIWTTGAAQWIADSLFGNAAAMSITMVIFIVTVFGIASHLLLPVGGAVVAVVVPVMATIAANMGINPALLVLPIGYTVSCVFLLPLDPIPLTTYGYKYWKLGEMSKIGVVISLIWIVLLFAFMMLAYSLGFL